MRSVHGSFGRGRAVAAAVAGALLVSACGSGGDGPEAEGATGGDGEPLEIDGELIADAELYEAALADGEFVLYTSLTEARQQALLDRFAEDTGIGTEMIRLVAVRLYERALSEAGSGVLEADVIMTTDLVLAQGLDDADIFAEYAPERFDELDDEFKGTDDDLWFVPMQSVNNIAYNTALVSEDEAPTSWEDLLDERWAGGKIVYTDAAGGSGWARELWLRENFGVEFWEAMAAQSPVIEESAGNATDLLARGEVEVGVSLPGNIGQAAADGAPLANVIPEEGLIAYNHHIGLVEGASNAAAAQVYLNWILSPAGQDAVATAAGDYPVMEGAPGPVVGEEEMPSADDGVIVAPSPEGLVDLQEEYLREWFDIFGVTG